jgi:hypothetical protein
MLIDGVRVASAVSETFALHLADRRTLLIAQVARRRSGGHRSSPPARRRQAFDDGRWAPQATHGA